MAAVLVLVMPVLTAVTLMLTPVALMLTVTLSLTVTVTNRLCVRRKAAPVWAHGENS